MVTWSLRCKKQTKYKNLIAALNVYINSKNVVSKSQKVTISSLLFQPLWMNFIHDIENFNENKSVKTHKIK